ncbi:MAG: FAD-binding protein [Kordiimonadaceae bacterium]|jgi:glycolate oxidase FAD binding subunit|nr:FAD-binding protein [Kordiimonadaceae bacterium]
MTENYSPSIIKDVSDIISDHIVRECPLDIRTNGSLIKLGHPMVTKSALSLKNFNQITLYEPEELVITLGPGVNLTELKSTLKDKNQELRFEPPDYGPLLGNLAGQGSIGGIIGCNLSGPKRFMAGAARDFILGVEGVSGYGHGFKAGGRVVKNVTGYDVSKLVTGAYGTLAGLTSFTLKLSPLAEAEISIIVHGLDNVEAIKLMSKIAICPFETSGLAYVPENISTKKSSLMVVRIEGVSASLKERTDAILKIIGSRSFEICQSEESKIIWKAICDVEPFNPPTNIPLWKISVPPSQAADVIAKHNPDFYYFDWAGGLIWMSSNDIPKLKSGAFWLIRGPNKGLPFTNQKDPVTKALMQRVKNSFDPKNILNPKRLGI